MSLAPAEKRNMILAMTRGEKAPLKILFVDDDPYLSISYVDALRNEG